MSGETIVHAGFLKRGSTLEIEVPLVDNQDPPQPVPLDITTNQVTAELRTAAGKKLCDLVPSVIDIANGLYKLTCAVDTSNFPAELLYTDMRAVVNSKVVSSDTISVEFGDAQTRKPEA